MYNEGYYDASLRTSTVVVAHYCTELALVLVAQADANFTAGGDDGGAVPQGLWDAEEAAINGGAPPRGGFEALTKKLQQSKNSKVRRTAQQYMDEYYALDFEDVIGTDLPTRFKYRAVAASSFGITDADMLDLSDKALNSRVPLRFVKSGYAEVRAAAAPQAATPWHGLQTPCDPGCNPKWHGPQLSAHRLPPLCVHSTTRAG